MLEHDFNDKPKRTTIDYLLMLLSEPQIYNSKEYKDFIFKQKELNHIPITKPKKENVEKTLEQQKNNKSYKYEGFFLERLPLGEEMSVYEAQLLTGLSVPLITQILAKNYSGRLERIVRQEEDHRTFLKKIK